MGGFERTDAGGWPFSGRSPPAALLCCSRDRRGERPQQHLAGWRGILQADADTGFNALFGVARKPGPILPAFCWAHVRRKFFELAGIVANARRGKKAAPISPLALEAVTPEPGSPTSWPAAPTRPCHASTACRPGTGPPVRNRSTSRRPDRGSRRRGASGFPLRNVRLNIGNRSVETFTVCTGRFEGAKNRLRIASPPARPSAFGPAPGGGIVAPTIRFASLTPTGVCGGAAKQKKISAAASARHLGARRTAFPLSPGAPERRDRSHPNETPVARCGRCVSGARRCGMDAGAAPPSRPRGGRAGAFGARVAGQHKGRRRSARPPRPGAVPIPPQSKRFSQPRSSARSSRTARLRQPRAPAGRPGPGAAARRSRSLAK